LFVFVNIEARYISGVFYGAAKGDRRDICNVPPAYYAVAAVNNQQRLTGI
jgi:hypothetical protein